MTLPALAPRPYQEQTIQAVLDGWKEWNKMIAVLPTGSGKTIIFAWLAQENLPRRTLILCHREELIDQAIEKIKRATGIDAGKEKAEFHARQDIPVVVASVQTMIRRLDRWNPNHFQLIVCDEAHHAISPSWQKVLKHFDGHAKVLGVTATPDRGDKRSLGTYFENVAIDVSLLDLIQQEYLCPVVIKSVPLRIDLSAVHLTAGDFNDAELGHALEPYLDAIARAIRTHASFRKVLAFLPLIDTSLKFVEACNRNGLLARHVDGISPDRKKILAAFADHEFDVLSNAMLLTEGYDQPDIDCVVVLRATKSRPLYAQMAGRGTRVAPTKDNLLLLDFLWMHEKHRIIHPADLLAKNNAEAEAITQLAADKSTSGPVEELDLGNLSNEVQIQREQALRDKLAKLASRKAQFISAEEFCVAKGRMDAAQYEPTMPWEEKSITEAQQKYLEQASLDLETVKGRGHASVLLDIIFKGKDLELATVKQRWVMRQNGYPGAHKATKKEAREFFAKKNAAKSLPPVEPEPVTTPEMEEDDIPF